MAGYQNTTDVQMKLQSCEFSTSVNLFLSLASAAGFLLNILPLYVVFKFQRNSRDSTPRTQGRDVLLTALCVLDLLTLLIPLPIYLSLNDKCQTSRSHSRAQTFTRPWLCEVFFLMFIWLKLSVMFLVTILNYTSYLALSNRRLYKSTSFGERLSSSFYCSQGRSTRERINNRGRSTAVLVTLVIGIALVAFTISSLPYLGLGPASDKEPYRSARVCRLQQISQPAKTKEYTFLFAVLMSSAACLLVHIVHSILCRFGQFLWRKNLKQAQELAIKVVDRRLSRLENAPKIAESYANLTCTLGMVFFASWIPLMVSVATIMSGTASMTSELAEYAVAVTFLNPLLDPVLYAMFVVKYRHGYKALLTSILGAFPDFFPDKHAKSPEVAPTNAEIEATDAELWATDADYITTNAEHSITTDV